MSKDGQYFHSDSQQHVLNGVYDKNNRYLRVAFFDDPPFRPSDIVTNIGPLEIALDELPYPTDPYPLAVLYAVDNDINDSFTYELVNNPSGIFKLIKNPYSGVHNILTVTSTINDKQLQAGDTLYLKVRVCDSFGLCYEKELSIDIVATASTPTPNGISLSSVTVRDLSITGALVGNLTATGGTAPYNFSILEDIDNKFQIIGDDLLLSSQIDRRIKIRHNVTIRVTDLNGGVYDKRYTISAVKATQPQDTGLINILLSDNQVDTGSTTGELVGILTTAGGVPPYTYTIISDPDNKFQIQNGDQLRLLNSVDYTVATFHTVTVKVVDINANEYTRTFIIEVLDPNDVGTGGVIYNIYNKINSAPTDIETLVTSYTVPVGKGFNLKNAMCSADNVAKFIAKINNSTVQVKRATWNSFNPEFDFVEQLLVEGDKIEIFVENNGDTVASFDATIIGGEYNA